MQETYPLVSVITGYYNRTRCLKESVQSILNQTYPNFEYIIFDDCSIDETYSLLSDFTKDNRLKLIRHKTNTGFVNGMINAVKLAKGKYIAVHGSGDISLPTRLEKQVKVLEEEEATAVVGCFSDNIDSLNGIIPKSRQKIFYNRTDLFRSSVLSHGETMYRRSQYESVGGYRSIFKFVQDGDLWLRLTDLGRIHIVQEVLYKRNIQADGVSFVPHKAIEQTKFSLLSRYINTLTKDEQQKIINQCSEEGIDAVISYKNKQIQKRLWKKFHTSLHLHSPKEMEQFIKHSSGHYKSYFKLVIKIHKFKILRSLSSFVYYKCFKRVKSIF